MAKMFSKTPFPIETTLIVHWRTIVKLVIGKVGDDLARGPIRVHCCDINFDVANEEIAGKGKQVLESIFATNDAAETGRKLNLILVL